MAYEISNRHGPHTLGSLKVETGEFTSAGGADSIVTKLGVLVYFQVQSLDGTADNGYVHYLNSASASATADDPGTAFITATLTTTGGGLYAYLALGY